MPPQWNSNASFQLEPEKRRSLQGEEQQLLPRTSYSDAQKEDMEVVDLGAVAVTGEDVKKQPKYIIHPESKLRRIWVMVTLVVAFYIIWVTPVRVGFDMQAEGPWFWIEGIIDIFFWVDLVLNFFTAYEHPITSELITDHKMIAARYMKSWFIIDLLATFPSDYIVKGLEGTWGCSFHNDCAYIIKEDTAVSVIVLLRTMRIFRIFWIFKNFNVLSIRTIIGRLQDEVVALRWIFSVTELLVVLLYLGHICGCFFYMFSHPKWQTPDEQRLIAEGELSTWVLDKLGAYDVIEVPTLITPNNNTVATDQIGQDPISGKWYSCTDFFTIQVCNNCQGPHLRCYADFGFAFRYITSMYWAYTTMTTVGYGDIAGTTIAEKVWCIITMVIGGFFLSYCFGRIASVVARIDAQKAVRNEEMENITQFLKDTELPKQLSRKVLDFFKSSIKGIKPYDRSAVLARLPYDIRSKVLSHVYLPTIKNVPILQSMTNDDIFITDLTIRMQPYHCSADTFVYQRGETTCDLYILVRGDLHLVAEDHKTNLYRIPEGTIFGEHSVIKHLEGAQKVRRLDSVMCKTPCDALRISLEDIKELCEHYPKLLAGLKKLDKARQQTLATIVSPSGPLSKLGNGENGAAVTMMPAQEAILPDVNSSALQSLGMRLSLPGAMLPRRMFSDDGSVRSLIEELVQIKQAMQEQQKQVAAELERHRAMIQQLPGIITEQWMAQVASLGTLQQEANAQQ